MKKLILYASVVALGLASCSKEYYVEEDNMPSWLGSSIYENLKTGNGLDGTFNTYLRLIDDCKYAETLGRTGSKTIFPANDDAFAAFFAGDNKYGAKRYEDLTDLQKQEILFSSMLDNAILIGNISSRKNAAGIMIQGQVVKHETNFKNTSYIETAMPWFSQSYPANNPYFLERGVSIERAVNDDTNPPMVHFTGEYMLNNNMTLVSGTTPSDFYILTGNDYVDGTAYVFDKKVVKSDVTCQNGYIHQLDGVLTNPGNMAQVIRNNKNMHYFSRMLDYFAMPVDLKTYPGVTSVRYISKNSQRGPFPQSIGIDIAASRQLNFDPGWNMYNPTTTGGSTLDDQEIAAVLAPNDEAVKNYFLGEGKYILLNLGKPGVDVNESTLDEHLDAVYNTDPSIFASFLNNVFKGYLTKTVPSKFSTVQNDAFEFMEDEKVDGTMLSHINKRADDNNKYDVTIANNGVIYSMDKFYTPKLYNSVLGPASVYTNLRTMGEMLNDHQVKAGTASALEADMYYYLLSMKARYAVFCPTDDDNSFMMVDPTSVGDKELIKDNKLRVLRFKFDPTSAESFHIYVDRLYYDTTQPWTNPAAFEATADPQGVNINTKGFNTQIKDLLDYCTIVLADSTETDKVTRKGLYGNRFYRTKNGGAICVEGSAMGAKVKGGLQLDNANIPASTVTQVFDANSADAKIENGSVYRLDFPMQPTIQSVMDKLTANPDFYNSEADYDVVTPEYDHYFNFCQQFSADDEVYKFAGILTGQESESAKAAKLKAYKVIGANDLVSLFSAYNYTMYVPTYAAMVKAQKDMGLPTWKSIKAIANDWEAVKDEYGFANEQAAKTYVKEKLGIMAKFVRYQTHSTSIFADRYFVNTVNVGTEENPQYVTDPTPSYSTFATIEGTSNPLKLSVRGGGDQLILKDEAGNNITIKASNPTANMLAREITVGTNPDGYPRIASSSFVTLHGIDTPLCFNKNNSYK